MLIDLKNWLSNIKNKQSENTIPKLGKLYIVLINNKEYDFIIPVAYGKTSIYALDVQSVHPKSRIGILKNIKNLSFSKQKLNSYEIQKIKFSVEVKENDWKFIEMLSTKGNLNGI